MRSGEIAAENDTLDRAELAYAMAGRRGDREAAALAHRVILSRLDRLETRREAQSCFFYHVVMPVTASSWECFVRLQVSSQRSSCQRGSCEH
jgi:hypothetical protein